MEKERVPTGWTLPEDADDNYEGETDEVYLAEIAERFDAIPATLYTDYSGANWVVIERNGERYVLPIGTD